MRDDEEPTRPRAVYFRCTECLDEVLLAEPSATAPMCDVCSRYMAPVNAPRGQA